MELFLQVLVTLSPLLELQVHLLSSLVCLLQLEQLDFGRHLQHPCALLQLDFLFPTLPDFTLLLVPQCE